jgi:cytochrome c oxidase assembly protein subunit 15
MATVIQPLSPQSFSVTFSPQKWFLQAYKFLLGASVALIALGGATRAVNAGLSCPDWPLCFWQVVPDVHYEVYYEFLHRVLAGFVGLFVIGFQGYLIFHTQSQRGTRVVGVLAIVVLLAQVVLGALTVLKLLDSSVVTMHLAFGVALFSLLMWNYWQIRGREDLQPLAKNRQPLTVKLPRPWILFLAGIIYAQIILGGLVSTKYAGLACPDFPLCQGQWIPTLQGLVGLHVFHRFGAYFVALCVLGNFLWARARQQNTGTEIWMLGLVVVQIVLGIANVVYQIPPVVTVLHLVTAVSILALALRQVHLLQRT